MTTLNDDKQPSANGGHPLAMLRLQTIRRLLPGETQCAPCLGACRWISAVLRGGR